MTIASSTDYYERATTSMRAFEHIEKWGIWGNIFIAYHFKGKDGKEVLGKVESQNVLHINMYFFSTFHALLSLSCKSKGE